MTGNTKQAHSPPDDEQSGPFKLWAGSGTGKRCDYCGKVILSDDVQYDVEVTGSSGGGEKTLRSGTLSFHLGCYDRWRAGPFK